jgi:hypothetical protein
MKSRLPFFEFSNGVNTLYVDGKRYTRSEFELAKKREKRRLKNGRFTKSILTNR